MSAYSLALVHGYMSEHEDLQDADVVERLYAEKGPYWIMEEYGLSKYKVYKILDYHEVDYGRDVPEYPRLENREWVERKYVHEDNSLKDIAGEVGCNPATVSRWVFRHGLKETTQ